MEWVVGKINKTGEEGGGGRTYGKGWRGRRWQGGEEMGTGRGVKDLQRLKRGNGVGRGDGASPPVMLLYVCC